MANNKLPQSVEVFKESNPDVWRAFKELGNSCHQAGPLDEKTRRLIKVALAVGASLEGATHSAVRNAIAAGVSPEEIRHVAILGITTLGFPSTMRALTWINDYLDERGKGSAPGDAQGL
jgi:alkylhydroperoxidase/carboxymuconolactone decarboxylase family protein YurZ